MAALGLVSCILQDLHVGGRGLQRGASGSKQTNELEVFVLLLKIMLSLKCALSRAKERGKRQTGIER